MDQTAVPLLKQFFAKYKPVLLILLVGIVLMLLPVGSKEKAQDTAAQPSKKAEETVSLQDQLSELLSQMAGAGKVKVLLTEAAGEETVYQSDKDSTTDENHQTDRSDTVILTDSARSQEGLICQINPPTYLGAVVLCQGADQPSVRLAITEAVANATGLGYHKITILKMK